MKLLFVCMGNICRSPTAEGVMRHLLEQQGLADRITVDSAGTHNYHPGKAPDARTQKHAAQRGYDLSALRARQVVDADFERVLDLIEDGVQGLLAHCQRRLDASGSAGSTL